MTVNGYLRLNLPEGTGFGRIAAEQEALTERYLESTRYLPRLQKANQGRSQTLHVEIEFAA
jgi:hypothetical protein